jgi:hypothetical protein
MMGRRFRLMGGNGQMGFESFFYVFRYRVSLSRPFQKDIRSKNGYKETRTYLRLQLQQEHVEAQPDCRQQTRE